MQYDIGAYALLADARTAALLTPDGNVAWLCWPRIDALPCLFGILDESRGGHFTVRPAANDAQLVHRDYLPGTLVLRSVWATPTTRLVVDDALAWDDPPRLLRRLHAERGDVDVDVDFVAAPDAGRVSVEVRVDGERLITVADGLLLALRVPAPWTVDHAGVGRAKVIVAAGHSVELTLADASSRVPASGLDATIAQWLTMSARVSRNVVDERGVAARVLGEAGASALLLRSVAVMCGLRQRGGGIVAAPTTSLPQWPGSSRTWDYRYAWLRDSAMAALAMLRLGMVDEAAALGDFCGRASAGGAPPPLLRVDGTTPPQETELPHLAGYRGARPVRVGNTAASQVQLDVIGEVLDLAHGLVVAGALPDSLRQCVPQLADALTARWRQLDHGIWEPRAQPRQHTHSRVMAWTGLQRAASMAERGAVNGNAAAWRGVAEQVRRSVLATARPDLSLPIHADGGGPDSALALIPLVGFLPPGDPHVAATLDGIRERLGQSGLVQRYLPGVDGSAEPCAPFVFVTFWLAAALERCGRDGKVPFAAACAARGELDLFGEVADPAGGGPLGNYPQVQSHAALVLAATAPISTTGSV